MDRDENWIQTYTQESDSAREEKKEIFYAEKIILNKCYFYLY